MENLNEENSQLISHITLRKVIGFIGIFLPIVLVLGSFLSGKYQTVQPSISDYYYTTMGDLFVGSLCAISLFLFCYKGYDNRDNITANIAAFLGICIAVFPTSTHLERKHIGLIEDEKISSAIHFSAAILFFIALAFFSIYLFTLSKGYVSRKKKLRNKVYKTCGFIILGCIVLMGIYFFSNSMQMQFEKCNPVLVLETIALWAFGISWITKAKTILNGDD